MASPTKRTRLTPDERRAQLIRVTEALVVERGASAVTLEDIADAAGVTVQLLYHYFGSRGALLAAMADTAFARFDAEVGALVGEAPTFAEKVRVLCRQILDPLPSLGVATALSGQSADSPEVAESLERHAVGVGLFVTQLIHDAYDVEYGRAMLTAAAVLGAAQSISATRAVIDADLDETEDLLVTLCLAMVRSARTQKA